MELLSRYLTQVREWVRAKPRQAMASGGVVAVVIAGAVAWHVATDDGPPPLHFPPRPKLEKLVFDYPPGALPEGAPRAVVPDAPKTFSGVQSAALELVRSERGNLQEGFKREGRCSKKPCDAKILVKADGQVVFDGERWAQGYIPTGRGEEVVRMKTVTGS